MQIIEFNAVVFWTILSGVGGLAGAFTLLFSIAKTKQNRRVELEHSCNELCDAISNSKIHTLLNNIIVICDKGLDDANSIIAVQKELETIYQEASTKWDALKSKLNAKKHKELLGELEAVFHNYQSCAKDAGTIVNAIGLGSVDEVKQFLSNDNSSEIRAIVNTASEIYENDLPGFVKQIISLRFKDLEIPDYASQIRVLINENYEKENVLEIQLLARMGSARAQNALGEYYRNQKQYKKAFSWFKKSAEQGFAQAQYNLGVCYAKGVGTKEDDKEAFKWYKESAEQGVPKAQFQLGFCCSYGICTEKDDKEAFKWFKKSAEQGYDVAQYNLGICYHNGEGTEKDDKEAFKWFKKSAEQGYAPAQCNLSICYSDGIITEKNEKEAFKWLKKSAEQDYAVAQYNLGCWYLEDNAAEKNEKEAFRWFEKSADQDFAPAQHKLGFCYDEGIGTKKDEKRAFKWYKKSAEQGYAPAQYNLGICYHNGEGCDQDYNQAFHWFSNAIHDMQDIETYPKSIYMIGFMYYNGEIGLGDRFTAVDCFTIAAQFGDVHAQYALGDCYENGIGVKEVDVEKAKYWYGEAGKQGFPDAIESLKRLESAN